MIFATIPIVQKKRAGEDRPRQCVWLLLQACWAAGMFSGSLST